MPFLPVLFAEATHAVTSDTGDVQVQACGLHFCIVPEQASPEAGLPRFGRKGVRVVPLQSGRALTSRNWASPRANAAVAIR
jgi:hypothetical protein